MREKEKSENIWEEEFRKPDWISRLKWMVMSKWAKALAVANEKEKQELLIMEKHEKIKQTEEWFCEEILANSEDFSPRRDIWYLNGIEEEYEKKIQAERDWENKFVWWLEKKKEENRALLMYIITLLTALGIEIKWDEETWRISIEDDLQDLMESIDKMSIGREEKMSIGKIDQTWWGYLEQELEEVEKMSIEYERWIKKVEWMKTPQEMVKKFMDMLREQQQENEMSIYEEWTSKETQAKLAEYGKHYEEQQEKKIRLKEELRRWMMRLMKILVREATRDKGRERWKEEKNGWGWVLKEILERWKKIEKMSEEELEELMSKIEEAKLQIETRQKSKIARYTKLVMMMERIWAMQGWDGWAWEWAWEVNNEEQKKTGEEWEIWKAKEIKQQEEEERIIKSYEEIEWKVDDERKVRAYTSRIKSVRREYETICNEKLSELEKEWIAQKKEEIGKKEEEIGKKEEKIGKKEEEIYAFLAIIDSINQEYESQKKKQLKAIGEAIANEEIWFGEWEKKLKEVEQHYNGKKKEITNEIEKKRQEQEKIRQEQEKIRDKIKTLEWEKVNVQRNNEGLYTQEFQDRIRTMIEEKYGKESREMKVNNLQWIFLFAQEQDDKIIAHELLQREKQCKPMSAFISNYLKKEAERVIKETLKVSGRNQWKFITLLQAAWESGITSLDLRDNDLYKLLRTPEKLMAFVKAAWESGITRLDLRDNDLYKLFGTPEKFITLLQAAWESGITSLDLRDNDLYKLLRTPEELMAFVKAVWAPVFDALPAWPELDRIIKYRAWFKDMIEWRIDHAEGIDGIIAVAESMIADGSFHLLTCGGLTTGIYQLWGKSYGIVDAGRILSKDDYDADRQNIATYDYNASPLRWRVYEPRRKAINNQDVTKRPSVIATKIQPMLDAWTLPMHMHHTWEGHKNNEFYDVYRVIQTEKQLTENDALLAMMYLQVLHGYYRVWGRNYVSLNYSSRYIYFQWRRVSGISNE
jgi:hypothetical protein